MTTIFMLDDEPVITNLLTWALEDEGFRIIAASSVARALDILAVERPALIITDYMMPGMNGIEFAEAVKRMDMHRLTPIMLMSGAQAYLGLARPDLFIEVLGKPFQIEQVIRKVKAALEFNS